MSMNDPETYGRRSRMPKFGKWIDGTTSDVTDPGFVRCAPIHVTLRNDFEPSQRQLKCRVHPVEWTTKTVAKYWATPCAVAPGACRVLTKRGVSDLATQLRFERSYVEKYPKPDDRGTVTSPHFVEWLQGFPTDWTDPNGVPVGLPPILHTKDRMRTLDLCTGCGGLTLALRQWCEVVAYCELSPRSRDLLLARMESGHLDKAPLFEDVRSLNAQRMAGIGVYGIDFICAGFPCQNISNAGDKRGLEGTKSSLCHDVARLVHELEPTYVMLENVAAITAMSSVWQTVLRALRAYDMHWCVIDANHAGAPQKRSRWFLLAKRREKRKDEHPVVGSHPQLPQAGRSHDVRWFDAATQRKTAHEWPDAPSLEDRMRFGTDSVTKVRLHMLGNAVNVRQGELAFRWLRSRFP